MALPDVIQQGCKRGISVEGSVAKTGNALAAGSALVKRGIILFESKKINPIQKNHALSAL